MNINFNEIFFEGISDEAAYHLVNFFIKLTSELESYYFDQMRQYIDDNTPHNLPTCIQNDT